jgi:hypothetical protein
MALLTPSQRGTTVRRRMSVGMEQVREMGLKGPSISQTDGMAACIGSSGGTGNGEKLWGHQMTDHRARQECSHRVPLTAEHVFVSLGGVRHRGFLPGLSVVSSVCHNDR